MNDYWFEKIDRYLSGEMSPEERLLFESEMAANKELESAFRVYRAIESGLRAREKQGAKVAALKNTLQKAYAENIPAGKKETKEPRVVFRRPFRTAVPVAASLLVAVLVYFVVFNRPQNIQQVAGDYISRDLAHISQAMSDPQDSLQHGIAAYNRKEYDKALRLFQGVTNNHPANREAVEYTGYVYLLKEDYDQALLRFGELAGLGGRFNRGKFLQAVTLLRRNRAGDQGLAKQLLQQVVNENAGGSKEAGKWLKKL